MSPGAAKRLEHRSELALAVDRRHGAVARGADASASDVLVDAVDRQLARRVERRDDDAVGVLEAGGELAEEVAHARVAVRLDHGDDAARARRPWRPSARPRSPPGGGRSRRRSATPFQVPVSWKRRLTPEKPAMRRADDVVGDAGLARRGNRRQRVERVVLAGDRHAPAADRARAAAHARAEVGVEDDGRRPRRAPTSSTRSALARGAVGQQAAAVAPQLQALDHVARPPGWSMQVTARP